MMNAILTILAIGCLSVGWTSPVAHHRPIGNQRQVRKEPLMRIAPPSDVVQRQRRSAVNIIEDCITVTSNEGLYYYKANAKDLAPGSTCGLYLITDPEKRVQVQVTHMDVACEQGSLISIVDGWEMNGELFPSAEDHELPLDERAAAYCGQQQVNSDGPFLASQNAALVQYRIAHVGQSFSVRVTFVKNPKPCNVLVEGMTDQFTISNYGRPMNCSVTTLYPASVSIVNLDIGASTPHHPALRAVHEPAHKCEEKGLRDYLQIGGTSGLDTSKLVVAESLCGVARNRQSVEETVACGITTVRLVSSGHFMNVATVNIRQAGEDDLYSASLMCAI